MQRVCTVSLSRSGEDDPIHVVIVAKLSCRSISQHSIIFVIVMMGYGVVHRERTHRLCQYRLACAYCQGCCQMSIEETDRKGIVK